MNLARVGFALGFGFGFASILSRIAPMAEPPLLVPSGHWTRGRLPSSPGVAP